MPKKRSPKKRSPKRRSPAKRSPKKRSPKKRSPRSPKKRSPRSPKTSSGGFPFKFVDTISDPKTYPKTSNTSFIVDNTTDNTDIINLLNRSEDEYNEYLDRKYEGGDW